MKDITNVKDKFITALLQNNSVVIVEIYERFFPKALRFILQNKGNHEQARDVFQESLLYIVIGVRERKLNIDCFEAYLFTICKNIWRRELEKQKKRVIKDAITTLVDKDTDFALFVLEQEQLELYREKFALLSDNCKEILSLFFNDVSYEEIIKELSYATINTARQRIFKCKNKLIKMIKSDSRFY
ncbi:RNA polymerase sigma factor [Aquimarina macrocephali]|uniref:RNA polymerase sigma factor n=1 Tax=Aquimarina macrocephali TaxID=666563 RepID=UPI000463387A|nr:sigma-70 family RNA polymerase sigma factor [Aquimarina macrocephali]